MYMHTCISYETKLRLATTTTTTMMMWENYNLIYLYRLIILSGKCYKKYCL